MPAVRPTPPPIRAINVSRDGHLEGLSSSVSTPGMLALRPQRAPSSPTQIMRSGPDGPPSQPPPTSGYPPASGRPAPHEKPLRTIVSPGITIVRPEGSFWQPHPVAPGVTIKLLYRDPRSGVYTALVRLAPGAQLPRRRHVAAEEALLVSGIAMVGTHEMRAGEYCRAESETIHEVVTTSTGCTFFLCGSEHDEFLDA